MNKDNQDAASHAKAPFEASASQDKPEDKPADKKEETKPDKNAEKKIELDKKIYEELIAKQSEAAEYKDKWLRALADYENLRKRVERERLETIKFSNQFLIIELFPIIDSFDSAINSIEKSNDKEAFLKGLKMLQDEFHRILEVNGLKKVKTVGEKFDPNLHQAEEELHTDKFPADVIMEEIRSGYTLNDRLLRPALVKVSKGTKGDGQEDK